MILLFSTVPQTIQLWRGATVKSGPGFGIQYRIADVLWSEVEANYTYWPNCKNEDLSQLFITPGLVVGKFPIWRRVGVMVGIGCQFAVTDKPLYHRNYALTARFPF